MISEDTNHKLEKRIAELEEEIRSLRKKSFSSEGKATVKVPEAIKPLFDKAQVTVEKFFQDLCSEPSKGTIEIGDERYLLVRAASLSFNFRETIKNLYADRGEKEAELIGKNFLFDIAHVIGINDAKVFHQKMNLTDPIAKLSAGPVHFAYSGWAFVEIFPESNPVADDSYYLIYSHPYSFEADSWIKSGKKSESPVCIMNSGYSSGWCEESFGIPLTAVEITCRAKGDEKCTFIMAPPHKIKEHLQKYSEQVQQHFQPKSEYEIPSFFERKETEEKINQLNKKLEKNNTQLEKANEKLDSFTYSVSHDLRAPLRAINGFLKIIEQRYSDSLDAEGQELFKLVLDNAAQMDQLINDLLAFSRAGKKDIKIETVQMFALTHKVINELKDNIRKNNTQITIQQLPAVQADYTLTHQVLVNLLSNAIKYSSKTKIPRVEIGVEEKQDKFIFYVKDNGIGFDPEQSERLFRIFERLHSPDEFEGTGIGLSIVQSIIHHHGGEVWAHSKPGEGAIFYFSLPKNQQTK